MSEFPLCTGEPCMLRDRDFNSDFIARLLLRVMSGEDLADLVALKPPFVARDQCLDCIRQVLRGWGPLRTVAEQERMIEAGQRSWRRSRRRRLGPVL